MIYAASTERSRLVLVDTSVWVEFLRRGDRGRASAMRGLLERGDVVLCGPVAAELIAGAAEPEHAMLLDSFRALPWADLDREAWIAVGQAAACLRVEGRRLPVTDLAIAVAAARTDVPLWTYDANFERISDEVDGFELIDGTRGTK